MKQTILILMLLLALSSCLDEGDDGCPDYIKLTFLHENSSDGFDNQIGNEVFLCLYQNDKLYHAETVPFEQVKGGKEHIIRKEVVGSMDIVAWAIPAGEENVGHIPSSEESQTRSGQQLALKPASEGKYEALGHLYLGTVQYTDTDITRESVFPVNMINTICQFSASMNPSVYDTKAGDENWVFEVSGTKNQMNLDLEPEGQDAVVSVELSLDSQNNILKSSMHGLLPSAEGQYISIKGYKGGQHIFNLNTRQQAKAGEVIHIQILHNSVEIYVNDWLVFNSSGLEWI